jgi:hypothetical protein
MQKQRTMSARRLFESPGGETKDFTGGMKHRPVPAQTQAPRNANACVRAQGRKPGLSFGGISHGPTLKKFEARRKHNLKKKASDHFQREL